MQSKLLCYVGWSVKRVIIFTMCHISELHNVKGLNYKRIGLSIDVEFILGR